jgi:hypothetical protein
VSDIGRDDGKENQENPECFAKHGDWVHGRDCAPTGEKKFWQQAFCATIQPYVFGSNGDDRKKLCAMISGAAADMADAAVAEAKRRGRL